MARCDEGEHDPDRDTGKRDTACCTGQLTPPSDAEELGAPAFTQLLL